MKFNNIKASVFYFQGASAVKKYLFWYASGLEQAE